MKPQAIAAPFYGSDIGGVWSCEPQRLAAMLEKIRGLDASTVQALKLSELFAGPPYQLVGDTAVISIAGPLLKNPSFLWILLFGATGTATIGKGIRAAVDEPAVKRIVLKIDSPGGQVAGTADLADEVRAAKRQKPVTAYIEDMGASAAYWIAAQADAVYANETAIVGSIGVYTSVWDSSEFFARAGVKVHLVSTGEHKGTGVDGVEVTEDQIAAIQAEVDAFGNLFVDAVSGGRRMSAESARALADGRVWVGADAKKVGLVDGIAKFDDVVKGRGGARMVVKSGGSKAIGSGAAAPPAPAVGSATIGKTRDELYAAMVDRVKAGYPRRIKAEGLASAIAAFHKTPEGKAAAVAIAAAPEHKAQAIRPASDRLEDIRAAAIEEERLEGPGADAVYAEIAAAAVKAHPGVSRAIAITEYTKARRDLHVRYARARAASTSARQAFVEALVKDELRPLIAGFEGEGLRAVAAYAAALKVAPGIVATSAELRTRAARGVTVAELEAGSSQRRRMVAGLVASAEAHIAKMAEAEFEPEQVTFRKALAEVLADAQNTGRTLEPSPAA